MSRDRRTRENERLSPSNLQASFRGRVIGPQDDDYDEARAVFAGGIDRHPAVIIRVADDGDVARAIALARDTGLELAVRSGGHSGAGHSVSEGGIVIDLAAMQRLEIDPESHTAWAQTGLTSARYAASASDFGLATGFGDTGSVGIGGLTLGGGVGFLVRKFGLTIDDVLAAEIVTADGELLRVDEEHHPDLFWALRGGGGNFGVATRFCYRLHELDTAFGGMLILPATPEVIREFVVVAGAAPEELSTIANIMPAPPMPFLPEDMVGQIVLIGSMFYAGGIEEGDRAVAPFRALATPLADAVRPMRYPEIMEAPEPGYHPMAASHSFFTDAVDIQAAETIVAQLQSSSAMMAVTQLRVLGGAMARVPVDATAFAHRRRRILANVAALYQHPEEAALHTAWASDLAAALRRGEPGVYVNFVNDEGEARVHEAYPGPTWERLAAIKARYDPANLFHLNQNIPPAETEGERVAGRAGAAR